MKTRSAARRRNLANSPFQSRPEPAIEHYVVNDRVSHDRYGVGRVVGEEDGAVIVDFGSCTVRVVSPFLKMEKL